MELWTRRKFFLTSLASSAVAGAGKLFGAGSAADAVVAPVAAGAGEAAADYFQREWFACFG